MLCALASVLASRGPRPGPGYSFSPSWPDTAASWPATVRTRLSHSIVPAPQLTTVHGFHCSWDTVQNPHHGHRGVPTAPAPEGLSQFPPRLLRHAHHFSRATRGQWPLDWLSYKTMRLLYQLLWESGETGIRNAPGDRKDAWENLPVGNNWTRHIIGFLKKKMMLRKKICYAERFIIHHKERKRHPSMFMSMPLILSRCTFCSFTWMYDGIIICKSWATCKYI